ncbi:MAG: lipocalin family protein [Verrucomicrobiales bacterium]
MKTNSHGLSSLEPGAPHQGAKDHAQGSLPDSGFGPVGTLFRLSLLRSILTILLILAAFFGHGHLLQAGEETGWKRALLPQPMVFPRDHHSHPDYKTEWWYFTGNLEAEGLGPVGFQFTLFRQGILPPGADIPDSAWASRALGFGHAALSFPQKEKFHFGQVLERGTFDTAKFPPPPPEKSEQPVLLASVKDWKVELLPDGSFHLRADIDGHAMDLIARPVVTTVLQGKDGLSQKAAGEGNASYYYSIPRLETTGTITSGGKIHAARGLSWLDREWASNQLGPEQVGWDWFALHLDDGRDLMVYRMRLRDGGTDPHSHGSLREKDGTVRHLALEDFELTPGRTWRSPHTGGQYPVEWTLKVPQAGIDMKITAAQKDQELALEPVSYYEGSVRATPVDGARSPGGIGYMELTGYARPLEALRSR